MSSSTRACSRPFACRPGEGLFGPHLLPVLRRLVARLVAIMPAVLVAWLYSASGTAQLLTLGQVALLLELPAALVRLMPFISDRKLFGEPKAPSRQLALGWAATALTVGLDLVLPGFATGDRPEPYGPEPSLPASAVRLSTESGQGRAAVEDHGAHARPRTGTNVHSQQRAYMGLGSECTAGSSGLCVLRVATVGLLRWIELLHEREINRHLLVEEAVCGRRAAGIVPGSEHQLHVYSVCSVGVRARLCFADAAFRRKEPFHGLTFSARYRLGPFGDIRVLLLARRRLASLQDRVEGEDHPHLRIALPEQHFGSSEGLQTRLLVIFDRDLPTLKTYDFGEGLGLHFVASDKGCDETRSEEKGTSMRFQRSGHARPNGRPSVLGRKTAPALDSHAQQ